MADEIYTFRTVRIVNLPSNPAVNIIADQEEDVLTFEAGANISLTVVEDRVTISARSPIGFSGSQGYTGSIGFQGSIGDRGPTGFQGTRGFDGSIGFTGSLGFTGSQGIQGNVGPTGGLGYTGSKGERSIVPGYTGSEGIRGPTGPQGNIGFSGSQGTIGYTGSRGDIGFAGSVGPFGFAGSQGDIGFSGSQGFTGSQGYAGSRGNSGYAGSRGFTGSRGIQGIQGNPGIRGYTGSQGSTGPIGETGYSGSRGFAGSTGYTGSKGARGPIGQGIQGFTGSQGVRGFTGSQGGPAEAFRTFRHQNTDTGLTDLIIADQPEDVMTFVSGKGIIIEFNEATDTITFAVDGSVIDDGGGGNAIVDINVVNNEPAEVSFITWDSDTQVLAYTPIDVSGFATESTVETFFQNSKDYANALVEAEAEAREIADNNIYNYVNENINRLEEDLSSNIIILTNYTDTANVYLQGLIQDEANARIAGDALLQGQINALSGDAGNILADLNSNVLMLQQEIQDVEANSIARDNTLQDNIDDVSDALAQEILDRIAGDQAVQDNLNANITLVNGRIDIVEQDLSDETNARISGDATLQGQIDTNTTNLANVANDLAQERLDRIAGDSNLQNQILDTNANLSLVDNRIDQEILDRIAGDQQNQANLETAVNLINADIDLLGNAIQTEANIRANADQALGGRIDIESGRNDVQDGEINDLDVRVAELENRVEFAIDYEANLTDLGNPNTQVPQDGEFIPMEGLAGVITGFTLDGPGLYDGGEPCSGDGFRAVLETGSGSGAEWQINYEENNGEATITSVQLLNPGTGYQAGDRFRIEADPGVCFGPIGYAYIDIDTVTTNTVTNLWEDVRALYINAVDDEGTFHFLDGIKEGDDLVFQHRTQQSFCRMEVTANVSLTTQAALTGTANVQVVPVAFNGDILPGNGNITSDYIVQFFPSVAGDVPTYDYVDTQDNRRVLKTGDTMTGALHMQGGDVVAYGNTGSRIKAIEGADVTIDDTGSLIVTGTGSVTTNKISNYGGSGIYFDFGGSNRFQIGSSGSYFLTTPARYTYQSAPGVGNIDNFDLIHKGYLDTRINNLDLGNTYVAKSGDTMFGELVFDDNIVNAIKIAPVDGSQVNINYFEGNNSSVTLVDLHLRGNTENNRYRILGGASAANAIVTYTASGNVYYTTDVNLTGNRITNLRNPDQDSDAANKEYVDGAVTQSQADIEDLYVNVAGDTMTGLLTITGGGIRVSNRKDVTVEGGDVKVTNSGSVVTNTLNSNGNSNLTLKRNDQDKLSFNLTNTTSYQPIRYNSDLIMRDDLDLVHRAYTERRYLKNSDTSTLTNYTTIDATAPDTRLIIKGPATGTGFVITRSNNLGMFYQEDNDIRLANTTFDSDNSVVSRIKGDQRYGLKGDFVRKSGDTMTGKLTTVALEVTGTFDVTNTNNSIDFKSDAYGKLLYKGTPRVQVTPDRTIVKGMLRIEDGLDSNTGLPIDGQINMNNRKIVNLLNPTSAQDAATKNYVDEAVADIDVEGVVLLTGNNLTETNWTIKNAADSKVFLANKGNEIGIYNVKAPTDDHHAMPRSYADGRYLRKDTVNNLSAGTTIKSNVNAKLYIQNGANNTSNFFKVLNYSGSELFGVDGDGMVRVPRTPSSDTHVANKKYVDDQVASAGSQKTWPGRRFKFTGYAQQSSVAVGNWSPTNANDTTQHLYFSSTDYDGIKIREGSPDFTPGVTMPGTVYKLSGGYWNAVGFFTWGGSTTDYRNDYIKLTSVTWKQKPSLSSGQIYAIVLGGRWG